jgi:hypothetical protein
LPQGIALDEELLNLILNLLNLAAELTSLVGGDGAMWVKKNLLSGAADCKAMVKNTHAAMTGRETPQARPRAVLEGTKTYGTFLSSQRRGRWRRISMGSVSA